MVVNEFTTADDYMAALNTNQNKINQLDTYLSGLLNIDSNPAWAELMRKPSSELTDQDRRIIDMNPDLWRHRQKLVDVEKGKKDLLKQNKQLKKWISDFNKQEISGITWIWWDQDDAWTPPVIAWGWATNTDQTSSDLYQQAVDVTWKAVQDIKQWAQAQLAWAWIQAAKEWWFAKWLATRTWSSFWEAWLAADKQQASFAQQAAKIATDKSAALTAARTNQATILANAADKRAQSELDRFKIMSTALQN